MRLTRLLPLALLAAPAAATAQDRAHDTPPPPDPRRVTVTAGAGTSMGWWGAQAERYLLDDRVSLFAGLGYAIGTEGEGIGPAFALGARRYGRGANHRAFAELGWGLMVTTVESAGGDVVDSDQHYGPAILGGYQYVADGGFTLMASLGVGYAVELEDDPVTPVLNLGAGYTWR